MRRAARDLHPGAWWLWALGLAAAATATTNPLLLLLLVAVAGFVVALRRSDHPWSGSFRLYLVIGAVIVLVRVLFRALLGGAATGRVLLDLPVVPLPGWASGVRLLGPITVDALLAGLYDGLRLATIIICVGAANALANPKRLLKSMPPALYEVGTAVVVAVAVLPQLSDSLGRVRAARMLRGVPGGRVARLRGVVVPVMEDALERSMALAAGMDARGYGRAAGAPARQRRTTGALMLTGLLGVCVGTFGLLDGTAPRWTGVPMLVVGVVLALAGFVSAGRRVQRTRYRPDRWAPPELLVAGCGVLVAVGTWFVAGHDYDVAHPAVPGVPTVTATALLVLLLGAGPALLAPPSPTTGPVPVADRRPEVAA
ncbi:MAG TPA: CbiQ family ECF transporter T component [Marmoricola sp.]|nr:CbiQ family ECF transporter T component [Marmoricola sp.]